MRSIAGKFLFLTFIFSLSANTWAQEAPNRKTIQVYVSKLEESSAKLNQFIKQNQGIVSNTDYSTAKYYCEFFIPLNYLQSIDSLADKIGYITQNTFNTENYNQKIKERENKIEQLKFENEIYTKQLKDTALILPYSGRNSQNTYSKISNNLLSIASLEVEANQFRQNANDSLCLVRFTINDELSTPNNSRVSFVNMPGLEYGILKTENPTFGTSSNLYQSVSVKYMFTRGKSYFNLGVYKALDNNITDTSRINEMFLINFGQDFYPRNFGRGKRKYLNLYTGYQIGGFITNQNNNKNSQFVPNANLSMGLELLKTKHVLIDNKVSYFLPLNELNRDMRGILYQASFNFVF
ncbi:MAG: hypothetical protein CFE21_16045 [Bacteroidetes bacterium B1(2017)]|nr:MAG: hypothetical protein CFE21_16045 [Bacteroidetes bacterium B1(2017)]